jgi:hypothetical protein
MFASSDFPKAAAVLRGCGERTPGGVYIECGLSPVGRPFDDFLIDPPLALPAGMGKETLANKPQFWTDPESDAVHLVIWVGEAHYPHLADFVEEAKRAGISRKISPHLLDRPDFSRVSLASRMILAHPRALETRWLDQAPPLRCLKGVPGHAGPVALSPGPDLAGRLLPDVREAQTGPCLFKTWELIPTHAAQALTDPLTGTPIVDPVTHEIQRKRFMLGGRSWYTRHIGSVAYLYPPTGESDAGLEPGIFGAFPITGFALVKRADGTVDGRAQARLERLRQTTDMPYFHADR